MSALNDALTVNSGTSVLDNQSGVLQAKGNIRIDAEQVNSQSGLISSEGGLTFKHINLLIIVLDRLLPIMQYRYKAWDLKIIWAKSLVLMMY